MAVKSLPMRLAHATYRTGRNLKPVMLLDLLRGPGKGFLRAEIGEPTLYKQRVSPIGHLFRLTEGTPHPAFGEFEALFLNGYLSERRGPVEFFLPFRANS